MAKQTTKVGLETNAEESMNPATEETLLIIKADLAIIKNNTDQLEGFVDGLENFSEGIENRLGEVQAEPTAYTILGRTKNIEDRLMSFQTESTYSSDKLIGGIASADSEFIGDYAADNGCDNDEGTRWSSIVSAFPHWWKYDFGEGAEKKIVRLRIKPWSTDGAGVKNFTLQGSNNDSDWNVIYTGQHGNNQNYEDFDFINYEEYRYYKIEMTDSWASQTYNTFYEIEMIEMNETLMFTNSDLATEDTLDLIRVKTDNLDTALSTILTELEQKYEGGAISATVNVISGFATSAKQLADNHNVTVSNIASMPVITGFATASNQTDASQKTQIVDGSGNVIASTSNALNVSIKNTSLAVTGTFWQTTQPVSIASAQVASGAFASGSIASGAIVDGADVTQGAKADARSTATDTTAITIMQVLKEISYMEQTPASRVVTNTVLSVVGNGAAATAQRVTLANDSTGIVALTTSTAEIGNVKNSGTFVVQATLATETTKVIGVVRNADGSGNLLTSTSNALDVNLKSGGITSVTADTELPAAAACTTDAVEVSSPSVASRMYLKTSGGNTWDRWYGTSAKSATMSLGANNAGTFVDLGIYNATQSVLAVGIGAYPTGANSLQIEGAIAHDSADAAFPVKIGFKAETSPKGITLVADGDITDGYADADGIQVVKLDTTGADVITEAISNTDGASTAFSNFGATASTYNYITSYVAFRTDAGTTMAYIDIRDGTGGAVLHRIPLPAGGGSNSPAKLIIKSSSNTALAFDVSSALTTVYLSVSGFKSKV